MTREFFGSRIGAVLAMVGVAVGLGNVWRFPYLVGRSGGAAFVLFYVLLVLVVGVPALAAEWALGRQTRRGTVGAFALGGLPFGRQAGWFFFAVVMAANAYYTAVIGWVLYHAVGSLAHALGMPWDSAAILPPAEGFAPRSWLLQLGATGTVVTAGAWVLLGGVRSGIERASRYLTPALFLCLLVVIARSVTLPGAGAGIRWLFVTLDPGALTPTVMLTALGQVVFSLALGGTYMVVYGSYLRTEERLVPSAAWTAIGDTAAGLLAGLAIFPAVFALGLEPASGPGLLFATLPAVFDAIPLGGFVGLLFFGSLAGAAFLSSVAAFEVLVAGLTDNTRLTRPRAIGLVCGIVLLLSLPPTLNLRIFVPWDLTFGSGMQAVGGLLAALTVGWCLARADALRQLGSVLLYRWVRYVIPAAILLVGIWWLAQNVMGAGGT
ncbi:MAG: sodium-dependent transporter [Gemmatimonadota bacterium]|nr:sodium-dependent transporter [Gemmatimonadota bacterium]